jgi:hypothetical protein
MPGPRLIVGTGHHRAAGREDLVVRLPRPGAQRASIRSRVASVLALSLLASLVAFGTSAAAPSGVAAADPPWYGAETYYLSLLNCTRTGGWVLKDGTCKGYGSGTYSKYVPPLKRGALLSDVSRRWARKLAIAGACYHGNVSARLRNAGFTTYTWGENIGCWDAATARKSVLYTHLAFQREKATGGGHWKNIKNARYKKVGIGVWRANGHTRLVTDFIGR